MQRMKARQAGQGAARSSLLSTWVFGCPDDPAEVRGCSCVGVLWHRPGSVCVQFNAGASQHPGTAASRSCQPCQLDAPSGVQLAAAPDFSTHEATSMLPCPPQFLASNGWQLQLQTDRAQQAAALGIDSELCAFGPAGSTNGSAEGRADGSLFLVCTPAAAATGAAQ